MRARRPHQRKAEEHSSEPWVPSEYKAERKGGLRAQRGAILGRVDVNRTMPSTVASSRRPMAVEDDDDERTSVCQLIEIEVVTKLTPTRRISRLCRRR